MSEPKMSTTQKNPEVWDIHHTKSKIGTECTGVILAIHALLGCDTISRIHSVGKGEALKKYRTNESFRNHI